MHGSMFKRIIDQLNSAILDSRGESEQQFYVRSLRHYLYLWATLS